MRKGWAPPRLVVLGVAAASGFAPPRKPQTRRSEWASCFAVAPRASNSARSSSKRALHKDWVSPVPAVLSGGALLRGHRRSRGPALQIQARSCCSRWTRFTGDTDVAIRPIMN